MITAYIFDKHLILLIWMVTNYIFLIFVIFSSDSKNKNHSHEAPRSANTSNNSTGERNKETQYYMVSQNASNENGDIDPRLIHRQGIHPSREQLTFDELGKVYTNISKRRIVSKVGE